MQRPRGLEWSRSRKALELAIFIQNARDENVDESAASDGSRLQARLHQLGLTMLPMEGTPLLRLLPCVWAVALGRDQLLCQTRT